VQGTARIDFGGSIGGDADRWNGLGRVLSVVEDYTPRL
jgi:hypothetical protein